MKPYLGTWMTSHSVARCVAWIFISFHSISSFANEFSDVTDSAYMFADYGLATYKSLLVKSNDTMGVVTYGIGANAGQNKDLGIEYRVESESVTFALNTSSIVSSWTSTIIKYRMWAFELGPVIGRGTVKATREGTEIMDVVSSGYGGYFGTLIPIGKRSLIYFNGMSVANSTVMDRKERTVALGSRLDLEIGTRIALTRKSLSYVMGYRRRSNSITEGGTAFNELQTSTFLGFQSGFDF
jgi:hypothetical protein